MQRKWIKMQDNEKIGNAPITESAGTEKNGMENEKIALIVGKYAEGGEWIPFAIWLENSKICKGTTDKKRIKEWEKEFEGMIDKEIESWKKKGYKIKYDGEDIYVENEEKKENIYIGKKSGVRKVYIWSKEGGKI